MKKEKQLNLTSGPILQTLMQLAVPIMASAFLGTAYNLTDMAWVGMLGSNAVAGIGVGSMYVWLSQGLVTLARMGGQVNVSHSCGRQDYKEARNYAGASLQLTILFGILFAAVCLLFTDPLLAFFKMDNSEAYEAAKIYLLITCGLIIFSFLSLTLTGLYTAQGDSQTPFKANLIGLVLNMILDPVLILGVGPVPRMEAAGAAIATVAAQFVVMAVLILEIFRKKNQDNVLRHVHMCEIFPRKFYGNVCRIGVPSACQGMIYCMISMVLTRMISSFGAGAVAVQRVGGQIESISWNTADGFGAALNAFVGQNYGAGKYDRIRKSYSISARILILWGCLIAAAFVFFPGAISRMFFHEADVIEISKSYLIIIGICEPFMCVELMTVGALSGLGKTRITSVISILLTGSRIPLALLLTHTGLGLSGVWLALAISSVAKGIVFYITFYHISHRLERGTV
jgi:putative MATE family efflux protein